jgi:hypothetical protein
MVRTVSIEDTRSRALRRTNVLVAAGLMSVVPSLIYYIQIVRGEAPYSMRELTWGWAVSVVGWLGLALTAVGAWFLAMLMLVVLTKIESAGIRLYGRVHKTRITPTVALALTAHATVGWIVGGVLMAVGFGVGLGLYEIAMHRNVDAFRGLMMLAPIWMPLMGGFVGLLIFETIVYLGGRKCRFANRNKPAA